MQDDGTLLAEAAIKLDDAIQNLDAIAAKAGLPSIGETIEKVSGVEGLGGKVTGTLERLAGAKLARDTPSLAQMNAEQTKAYIDNYATLTGLSGPGYIAIRDVLAWNNEMFGHSADVLDLVSDAMETGELDMEAYEKIHAAITKISQGPWTTDTIKDMVKSVCSGIPGIGAFCDDVFAMAATTEPDNACIVGAPFFQVEQLSPTQLQANRYDLVSAPDADMQGNWIIRWESNSAGFTHGYAALRNSLAMTCNTEIGCQFQPSQSGDMRWLLDIRVYNDDVFRLQQPDISVSDNGQVEVSYGFGMLGLWGGKSLGTRSGDRIEGNWSYVGRGGSEIWTRAPSKVTSVGTVLDGSFLKLPVGNLLTISLPAFGPGSYMRGNLPEQSFFFFGENLWGYPNIWIPPQTGLGVDFPEFRCGLVSENSYEYSSDGVCEAQGKVSGMAVQIYARGGHQTGLQYIYVDDQPIPFWLEVTGDPGENTAGCTQRY